MDSDALRGEEPDITAESLQRVLAPIESARGLPNHCYTAARVFARERKNVFAKGWACAGFAVDAPNAGDVCPVDFAGMPLVMVRGADRLIRVFHNVCRHRGRVLVDTPSNVKKSIVCPYHRWTYALDGRLTSTPHVGGPGAHHCAGFDSEAIRLAEIRSAEWLGLIFVDLSNAAEEFDRYIAAVAARWRAFRNVPLVHTGTDSTITFTLDCNWKLAVENYCEAYHLPWVHPGLSRYSPLERHHSIVDKNFSGQWCESYAPRFPEGAQPFPNAPRLPAYWETSAEYIALFPNVLLGMHRDHFYAVPVLPDGPNRTHERLKIFYFNETVRGAAFDTARAANRDLWQAVFAEDREAVEGMQRGRQSPGFDGGVFSPAMDPPTHAFHGWIARSLLNSGR